MSAIHKTLAAALLLAVVALPAPSLAGCPDPGSCVIVRVPSGLNVASVLASHGLTLVEQAHPNRPNVFLAQGPAGVPAAATIQSLAANGQVSSAEQANVAFLSEDDLGSVLGASPRAALNQSYTGLIESSHFATAPWSGYADQVALHAVRIPETHALPRVEARGTGVVAIIDTGVDPDHPLLQGALVAGYDFLLDQPGIPSEWNALVPGGSERQDLEAAADQSYTGLIEGNAVPVAKGEGTEVLVDQSYTGLIEGVALPPGFGHGTMVAGIVRAVAPGAQIMPLRAFDGDGTADLWDIVKAIYHATLSGADVINMSFSIDSHSPILAAAIKFAKARGVICVSSTGNEGSAGLTYPAALGNVIGVASVDDQGQLSSFSNFGLGLATVAAPGEAIVTLYPGGGYAGAWGTSFSSAFVSGTVALLNEWRTQGPSQVLVTPRFALAEMAIEDSADNPDPVNLTDWGAGRLDSRAAFALGLIGE